MGINKSVKMEIEWEKRTFWKQRRNKSFLKIIYLSRILCEIN
jgi:hypothetical protein